MNILIVKLSAIGDVVHTFPSLAMLRKLYPSASIAWVIEDDASDLIIGHPYLDQTIVSHRKRWIYDIKRGKFRAIREIIHFVRELRSRHYDLVIDFHGLLKSSLIVFLARGKRKLGYDSMQELSGLFLNEKIPEDRGKHAVNRYLDFIRYLYHKDFAYRDVDGNLSYHDELMIDAVDFSIPITKKEEDRVARLLKHHGLDDKKYVAVNPIAFGETKLWEEKKFAQLGDLIVQQYNLSVIFTGTEQAPIDRIQSAMSNPSINLAGKTSLRELACLYRGASLIISTDSGPMHIAAAMGTPVLALFGPTDPVCTGPYGKGHAIIRKEISCSPCFLKKCASKECMRLISVEEVFQAVGWLIGDTVS